MRVFLVRYPPCPHAVLLVRCLLSAANGQSERGTASAGSNSERHGGPRELPAAPASGPGTELNTSRERLRARPHVVGSGSRATRASAVARARRSAFPPPQPPLFRPGVTARNGALGRSPTAWQRLSSRAEPGPGAYLGAPRVPTRGRTVAPAGQGRGSRPAAARTFPQEGRRRVVVPSTTEWGAPQPFLGRVWARFLFFPFLQYFLKTNRKMHNIFILEQISCTNCTIFFF